MEVVDNVRLIKSIEKTKDQHLCTDPDIAMAMRAKGYDIVKKRPWMVMDREVKTEKKKFWHRVYN